MPAPLRRWLRKAATNASPAPVVSSASIPGTLHPPAACALSRLCAGRAALHDDQRVKLGKPSHWASGSFEPERMAASSSLGNRIDAPRVHARNTLRSDLPQEFRRRRIDANGLDSRAPHRIENRRARRGSEERIAGKVDVRSAVDQTVGNVGGLDHVIRAPVGEEAALAVGIDERHQPPGLMLEIADQDAGRPRSPSRRAVSLSTSLEPTRATKSTLTPKEASHAA